MTRTYLGVLLLLLAACRAPTPAAAAAPLRIPKVTAPPVATVCAPQTAAEEQREIVVAMREQLRKAAYEAAAGNASVGQSAGTKTPEQVGEEAEAANRETDAKLAAGELPPPFSATRLDASLAPPLYVLHASSGVDAGDGEGAIWNLVVARVDCHWQDTGADGEEILVDTHRTPAGDRLFRTENRENQCGHITTFFRLRNGKAETVASYDGHSDASFCGSGADLSRTDLVGDDELTAIRRFVRDSETSPWEKKWELVWNGATYAKAPK